MKVYPTKRIKKEFVTEEKVLNTTERITKVIALTVAFVTVYFFFLKILFF